MDDWDKWWFDDGYPCKYCDGPHLDIVCPICHICGGQYGYWNGCPNSYSPPPIPYYDSSVICDDDRGDEVENVEQEACNIYLKQIMDMLDKNNLALMELESIFMEQRANAMELQAKCKIHRTTS
ncbi:hypothetical protein R3W88_011828 [Solanum pinnatisectum]|uniref:Uncharacterized protein n=1 Tax=Solanum pinnatisectum TaxID=50273 RepID=A0AAV9LAX3_9SOLN|nr:hypothetical protein R3W88_011828 [Solanum pinnatisectum]